MVRSVIALMIVGLASFLVLAAGQAPLGERKSDPAKKELVAKREDLENKIDALKYQKAVMAPVDYQKQLTQLLVELSKVQEAIDK